MFSRKTTQILQRGSFCISSDDSYQPRKLYDFSIEQEIEDQKQSANQDKSIKFLSEKIFEPGDNSAVRQLLNQDFLNDKNHFAWVLNTVVCIIHIYNFFTCFIFMGIEGYPEGLWLVLEMLFEVILVFELIMQFILRNYLQDLWKEMSILHGKAHNFTYSRLIRYLLVAFPQTIILTLILHKSNPSMLLNWWIAALRILKLLRCNEVKDTFDRMELKQRQKSTLSLSRILFILLYFEAFLHLWTCVWLMTGRLDWSASDQLGWYNMAKFYLKPTKFEMYMESYHFIVSTFSGSGFGNIIPTTNAENFVDTFINLIGSSLFACIFVDFVMEFRMRNLTQYANDNLLDESLYFAENSRLPESLEYKIRYFYKDLNLKFEDFLIKQQIITEMPPSIKGQVAIMLNREIIESVKFFQMADQKFIEDVSCLLCPQVCINDDYICHKDEGADKMYFVHSGYIEILQQNGTTPLIYFGKGAYFGEIGVLITGKRTLSVKAKTNAVIYYIPKQEFLELLDNFPHQKKFLRDVAQQRLQSPVGAQQDISQTQSEISTPELSVSGGKQESTVQQELNVLFERKTTTHMSYKPWFNQKLDSLKFHIMIPFSPIWWLWNITLIVAITLNSLLIPYGISFERSFHYHPIIICCIVVYIIDIPMRLRTGVNSDQKISVQPQNSLRTYFDKWLIMDVVATFPFEWILVPSGYEMISRYVLLLRLLKVGRLIETCEIMRKNSRHSYSFAVVFMELFCLYGYLLHWMGCFLGWVGRREYVRNPKYDGNTFFKDFASRPFLTLGPFEDLPMWDQYTVCIYVVSSILHAATFGDAIPQTIPEQWITMIGLHINGLLRSYLIIRVAKYFGDMQKQQTLKIQTSRKIERWMKSNKISKEFMSRIKQFTHGIRHNKSMYEGSEIIENLPFSLQTEIRKYLLMSHNQEQATSSESNTSISKLNFFLSSKFLNPITQKMKDDARQKPDLTKQYKLYVKIKKIKEWIILLIVTWNVCFIPLQFSYKLVYNPGFLTMEVITIIAYLLDIGFHFHTISWMQNLDCVDYNVLKRKHKTIKQSAQHKMLEIERQKFQIWVTLIAFLPISFVIKSSETLSQMNMYAIVGLCTLRLIKVQPFLKFFLQKQKDALTQWRIISTVFYYYCIVHWFACIMVYMVIYDDDWTANWLRRCPVPQVGGTRTEPAYRDDLSNLSVYVHALYYCQSTLSHVAIADITAVRQNEFVANAIFQWLCFFIYAVLFADITLLVSNAGSGNYRNFIKRRNDVISKLKSPNIPQSIVSQAMLFLDYTYEIHEGVEEVDVMKELPDNLKLDFLLEKYRNVINQSLMFRVPKTAELDMVLAQEVLMTMKTQIYLDETFILKVGQVTTDAILLLEGNINVLTINQSDVLGSYAPGDYYATDLDEKVNDEFNIQFFMKTQKDTPPQLQLNPSDNLENRSMVHLIARKFVTVGSINQVSLEKLYRKFPMLKTVMQKTNRYMFDVGRKAIESILMQEKRPITRDECLNVLVGHFEKSSDRQYQEFIRAQRPTLAIIKLDDVLEMNVSQSTKQYYIDQLDPIAGKKFTEHFVFEQQEVVKEPFILCCEEFVILDQSFGRRIIRYTMFCNRIYIALFLPFYIAFNVLFEGKVLVVEYISHMISLVCFALTFRTPVLKESGELTLEFMSVYQNYVNHGFIYDVIAFLPFNLILPKIFNQSHDRSYNEWIILVSLTPLRLLRLVSTGGALAMYDQIKIDFRKKAQMLTTIGNIFFIVLIGHWCVCMWVFLTSIIEDHYQMNWQSYQNLEDKQLWEVYIRNWYAIANIVSSVGSGDIFGTTDLERLFFVVLMCCADIVFALAFGLLAELTTNARADNPEQNFFNKMLTSQRVMQNAQFNDNWRDRVQQYRTYKHELQTSYKNLTAEDLRKDLPECLIKEILYHSNRTFLVELFKGIESENLMRDLAFATSIQIFMPDDVVLPRKKTITQIYYIVEGCATKFNKRNKAIEFLQEGQFCGDFALLKDVWPRFEIRAQTFMLAKVLKKSDVDSILDHYPHFKKELLNPNRPNIQEVYKKKTTSTTHNDQFNASASVSSGANKLRNDEHSSNNMRGSINSVDQILTNRLTNKEHDTKSEVSEESSSSSSESDSVESVTMEQESLGELGELRAVKPELNKNFNRGRRQTLDAHTLMKARDFVQAQRLEFVPPADPMRRSRQNLADQVRKHYKNEKQEKKFRKPVRRLSQVSIGSKLTVRQSLGKCVLHLEQ